LTTYPGLLWQKGLTPSCAAEELERRVWKARVALLDSLYYDADE